MTHRSSFLVVAALVDVGSAFLAQPRTLHPLQSHAVAPKPMPSLAPPAFGLPATSKPMLRVASSRLATVEMKADIDPIKDSLAGLTVAFSLLSKGMACASLVGVSPLVGIWSSVVMGVTAPLLKSRPGVISGAAAVVIVPLSIVTATHGTAYIPLVIAMAAVFQGLFGIFKLSKYTALVTDGVMSGFLNALGIVLFQSQIKIFTQAPALWPAIFIAALCFAVVQGLPKLTKAIPSSLAGLLVATAVAEGLGLPLKTLTDQAGAAAFAGGFSSLPTLIDLGAFVKMATSISALKIAIIPAISISFIALLETLLAGRTVDNMLEEPMCTFDEKDGEIVCLGADETDGDVPNQSVLAMATGNMLSAFLGGFGGCGLIPQTVLNVKSGGGGPFSSAAYALSMIAFVVFLAPLVGKISLAALAGIMFCVAFDTVQWGATLGAAKAAFAGAGDKVAGARTNLASLLVSAVICYKVDMAAGIVSGVIVGKLMRAITGKKATA